MMNDTDNVMNLSIGGTFQCRLRDRSMDVRLSTLQILTQLILNDMIKVKGQISEIALCILDDDPSISYTAKMFFTEFARKVRKLLLLLNYLQKTLEIIRNYTNILCNSNRSVEMNYN